MDASPLPVISAWADAPAAALAHPTWPAWPQVEGVAATPLEALRRAEAAFPGRDVLLLSADAWLPRDAGVRLRAAMTRGDWDAVSALDACWNLFETGTPAEQCDALAWSLGEHAAFACQGWSAVCSLWRGDALASCDLSNLQALKLALLPCLHAGGTAASTEGDEPEPVRALRKRLGSRAAHQSGIASARPVLLHVLHDWGGGVERFARDLAAGDDGRQHLLLVARSEDARPPFGRRICLHLDLDAEPLRTWTLSQPIPDCSTHSPELREILAQITQGWGVGAVLVSSLIGLSLDVLRTELPTAVCVHDMFPLWPLLQDARDPATHPFDREALERSLAQSVGAFPFRKQHASHWLELRAAYASTVLAKRVRMVAPSEFAKRRVQAISDELIKADWDVLPHGVAELPRLPPPPRRVDEPMRVLVPGRIHGGKGEQLLRAMLPSLPPGITLQLLGCGHCGQVFQGDPRVEVIPDYPRAELAQWVAALAPEVALLPASAPETFSYTLSEMLALGIPVVCASPGAPAERLTAYGRGWVVRPAADDVNALLARLAADRTLIDAERARPLPDQPLLADSANQWRRILPPTLGLLALAPAGADTLRCLYEQDAHAQLAACAASQQETITELRLELDERADWAHRLQRQIESLDATRQCLAAEVARGEAERVRLRGQLDDRNRELAAFQAIHQSKLLELEQELAAAHGYYQRDTVDLARQRDMALAQREGLSMELELLRSTRVWRYAALPRKLYQSIRERWLAGQYHLRHLRSMFGRGINSLRTRGLAGTYQRLKLRAGAYPAGAPKAPQDPAPVDGPLALPLCDQPRVSIIIPVYNQLGYTLDCLRSIVAAGAESTFEVIVVDDGSTDDSLRFLPRIPGLRYQRNARNLGFIGTCNAGARSARGEFLVFLNNDTTVKPGWLDALLATFGHYPDTGMAGSKLVYPDGRLQEAGGIIFSDGSGWNYGRFEDPAHPRFNYVREVDYCSGAAIAMRRAVFESLGGFDPHYAPAYYEDTDLAMRVRQHGLKVRYQPASVVVHHEGVSSGTSLSHGVKRHQATNQVKFLDRWREVLASDHAPPGSPPERACERGRRHQVLVLDACTPTPDRDSGSLRMLAIMRLLREQGCSVVFFPENRAHDGPYTEALQQLGVEAWWHPHLGDVPGWLVANGARFDLVIASRHYVLEPVLPLLRSHARRAHVVFDTVDLHHMRELREAEMTGDPGKLRAAARTQRIELGLIAAVDTTWVVSHAERALLSEELPDAAVAVVSNIHEVEDRGPPFAARRGLLFVGSYRHPPNVDAAQWLADEILPRIRAHLPDVELHLVGGDAPAGVAALGERDGIRFHGHVPDLGPLLTSARISVAPLRYGAGVKGKVNQALAHGLPVVATTCAVEGMFLQDGRDVLVGDDADAFAAAVLRLHEDAALWEQLALGGQENTRRHFSSDAVRETLRTLLAALPPR